MPDSNDPIRTDVVVDPMAGISTKEAGITRTDCWEKYAELLTNHGNENKAVRLYLVWLMEEERTKPNFNKIFTTDDNRREHVKKLKSGAWLTDDNMNAFAASLGFSLTYVLTHNSHVPPYVSPDSYAGFSVAENAPNAVVINSSNTHWRPFEHDVLGDGNCGAYTLASIARRFAPPKVQQKIIAARNSAKWTTETSPSENHNPGLTLEQKEKIYIEKCKAKYEELDKQADRHAEDIGSLLLTKTPEELIQILEDAKGTAITNHNAEWLNGSRATEALDTKDKEELIHVLKTEAKNTFHDPDNEFFRQLLLSHAGDNKASPLRVIPKPLQKTMAPEIQYPGDHPTIPTLTGG